MKTKTALLAMGLFTLAGAVTVSCGGSSDEDNGNGSTAGTAGSSAGTTATAGTTGNGGTTSTAGTSNNTAGTNNNNGGTNNNAGGADNNNNNGGAGDPGPDAGGAGDPGPGAGGAGPDGCPASMPADGSMCVQGQSGFQGCDYGDMNCRCRRANGQMREWQCQATQGAGGAGNFGDAVCPADAMDGNPCTGTGPCDGQQGCFCFQEQINCF